MAYRKDSYMENEIKNTGLPESFSQEHTPVQTGSGIPYEDAALKVSMQFFADELLPYLGIEGKVAGFAPTESVQLELHKLYQDFNLIMEDGTWKHFEFQSKNEGLKGLKRFRAYEATISYYHNVEVSTYVLFSGKIKNPMTSFTEGANTYRILPIIMKEQNGDVLIQNLIQKVNSGETLSKKDLVPLTLCLLMDGKMAQKDRIKAAFLITGKAETVDKSVINKIEAVIYAMAEKFLDSMEMNEIMEGIKMTRLGQMLVNEGRIEGRTEGEKRKLLEMICKKLRKGKSIEQISDELEEEMDVIQPLCKAAAEFAPEYDCDSIYNKISMEN